MLCKNCAVEFTIKEAFAELGLTQEATKEAAKNAYRQLAKQYHSDTGGESQEKMTNLNLAYEVVEQYYKDKDKPKKTLTLPKEDWAKRRSAAQRSLTDDKFVTELHALDQDFPDDETEEAYNAVNDIVGTLADYKLNGAKQSYKKLKAALDDLAWDIDGAKDKLKYAKRPLGSKIRAVMDDAVKAYKEFLRSKV